MNREEIASLDEIKEALSKLSALLAQISKEVDNIRSKVEDSLRITERQAERLRDLYERFFRYCESILSDFRMMLERRLEGVVKEIKEIDVIKAINSLVTEIRVLSDRILSLEQTVEKLFLHLMQGKKLDGSPAAVYARIIEFFYLTEGVRWRIIYVEPYVESTGEAVPREITDIALVPVGIVFREEKDVMVEKEGRREVPHGALITFEDVKIEDKTAYVKARFFSASLWAAGYEFRLEKQLGMWKIIDIRQLWVS